MCCLIRPDSDPESKIPSSMFFLSRCGSKTEELAPWSAKEPRKRCGSLTVQSTMCCLYITPLPIGGPQWATCPCPLSDLHQPILPRWKRSWRKAASMDSVPLCSPLLRRTDTMVLCMVCSREGWWAATAPQVPMTGVTGPSQAAKLPLPPRCGVILPRRWQTTLLVRQPTSCIQQSSRCTWPHPTPTPPPQTPLTLDTGTSAWTTAQVSTHSWKSRGVGTLWTAVGNPSIRAWSSSLRCLSCPCRRFWVSWMRSG